MSPPPPCAQLAFPPTASAAAVDPVAAAISGADPSAATSTEGIDRCEAAVFFGDLNFRLAMPAEEVHAAVAAGELERLRHVDQLALERHGKRSFVGWNEAPLVRAGRGRKKSALASLLASLQHYSYALSAG